MYCLYNSYNFYLIHEYLIYLHVIVYYVVHFIYNDEFHILTDVNVVVLAMFEYLVYSSNHYHVIVVDCSVNFIIYFQFIVIYLYLGNLIYLYVVFVVEEIIHEAYLNIDCHLLIVIVLYLVILIKDSLVVNQIDLVLQVYINIHFFHILKYDFLVVIDI